MENNGARGLEKHLVFHCSVFRSHRIMPKAISDKVEDEATMLRVHAFE